MVMSNEGLVGVGEDDVRNAVGRGEPAGYILAAVHDCREPGVAVMERVQAMEERLCLHATRAAVLNENEDERLRAGEVRQSVGLTVVTNHGERRGGTVGLPAGGEVLLRRGEVLLGRPQPGCARYRGATLGRFEKPDPDDEARSQEPDESLPCHEATKAPAGAPQADGEISIAGEASAPASRGAAMSSVERGKGAGERFAVHRGKSGANQEADLKS
jgi:hypothetical protein